MNTANITSEIPSILNNVSSSLYKITPITVATIGSNVAIIEALLVSRYDKPLVYNKKGNTVAIKPNVTAYYKAFTFENRLIISLISVNGIKPILANIKVYRVTVIESYFFSAYLPNIL